MDLKILSLGAGINLKEGDIGRCLLLQRSPRKAKTKRPWVIPILPKGLKKWERQYILNERIRPALPELTKLEYKALLAKEERTRLPQEIAIIDKKPTLVIGYSIDDLIETSQWDSEHAEVILLGDMTIAQAIDYRGQ